MDKNKNNGQTLPPQFRFSNLGITLIFVLLVLIALAFVHQERGNIVRNEIDQRLAQVARETAETLRLSAENLQAASSIMVYFKNISFAQFKGVAGRYFESDPGLLILEWQPVVAGSEREEFVRQARAQGLSSFRLWEPDAAGKPILAAQRDEHVPVFFMLSRGPDEEDVDTFGLDLAWSPERMQSKWDARDLGRAQASGLFGVVTAGGDSYQPLGFAITLPVYRNGFVPNDLEDRKTQLMGYMAGVYSVESLLKPQINLLGSEGFNLEVHDRADNENRLKIESGSPSDYFDEVQLDLFGNSLHLRLTATERFVSDQFELLWVVLPGALMFFGVVIFFFLRELEAKHIGLASAKLELEELNTKLTELSRRDSLTGLLNRRAFMENLNHELDRLQRYPETMALLMLDLDHFKEINDQWGHPQGDAVLVEFAREVRGIARNIDAIGRLGGEEFAILLVKTTRKDADAFAERLRKSIARMSVPVPEMTASISVTVSIGFSLISQPISGSQWIRQADKALYLAKLSGRNCVREYEREQ